MITSERPQTPKKAVFARTQFNIYTTLVVMMVATTLISNIAATKGVLLFPSLHLSLGPIQLDGLYTDGAFFLFPLAYVLGDVISEVYGFKAMVRAVLLSFTVTALAALSFTITLALPGVDPAQQDAMTRVVGVVPWILAASVCGFIVGELVNSGIVVRLKRMTGERGLVGRLLSSSVLGELADTTAFGVIAAPVIGFTSATEIFAFIVIGWMWKTSIEVVVMPITVAVIAWIKRAEPTYELAVPAADVADSK